MASYLHFSSAISNFLLDVGELEVQLIESVFEDNFTLSKLSSCIIFTDFFFTSCDSKGKTYDLEISLLFLN